MSKLTQKAIMNAFLEILTYKTLDKITVKDIIETTEINRNTFYYYYEDIYDLLDHIFNEEIEKVLSETPEDATFYEEYIRAASIFINHRQAIIHIYNSKSRMLLFTYLETVTNVFVERFVKERALKYNLSQDGIKYITSFYSTAIVGNTLHWIDNGMSSYSEKVIKMMSNSFEATIDDMIKDYQSHNYDSSFR